MDVFAGSQAVSYYMKQRGFKVFTNDFMSYSNQIGKCLIENNTDILTKQDIKILFNKNRNDSYFNLIRETFTDIFFKEEDSNFLDSFRSNIELLHGYKKNLALAVINRAITRKVTMGHFAHSKALEYATSPERVKRNRSLAIPIKNLFLEILPSYNNAVFSNKHKHTSCSMDAIEFIKKYRNNVDLVYFDPPYCNSHADYQSFYHLLETYTQYWKDKKFINKVKCYFPKKKSGFVKKKEIVESFKMLFKEASNIKYWIISYNNRSYPCLDEMISILREHKNVKIVEKEYINNVGGKGSVKGSKELLFICT